MNLLEYLFNQYFIDQYLMNFIDQYLMNLLAFVIFISFQGIQLI